MRSPQGEHNNPTDTALMKGVTGFYPYQVPVGFPKKQCAALTGCALLYRAKCALVEQGLVSGEIPVMGGTDGMETCSRTTYSNLS